MIGENSFPPDVNWIKNRARPVDSACRKLVNDPDQLSHSGELFDFLVLQSYALPGSKLLGCFQELSSEFWILVSGFHQSLDGNFPLLSFSFCRYITGCHFASPS